MILFDKPSQAIKHSKEKLYNNGWEVFSGKWQSIDVEHSMWELFNHSLSFKMPKKVSELRKEVKPNLPWADDHFQERVGGVGLNPGEQYKNWPYYVYKKSNDKFRTVDEKFSHTYMERIWPDKLDGIRYKYGNLDDVVDLLKREPYTRQAFLPIWHPEDTGAVHGERVPCTLGYHFIRRENYFHVFYYIRSCDYIRHFRDDIYLCVRKLYWILEQLKNNKNWKGVNPGTFNMFITSLHVFKNEKEILKQSKI